MKVCVYAIAKNEEKFADRFMDAAAEADYIRVLDTGSTDKTVERLEERGASVHQETIEPWRFDEARNRSMKLIPEDTDIAACVDLDEVLSKGWRERLEAAWKEDTEQARFTCVRSRNGDGSPGTSFLIGRAHKPGAFRWKYPVHEVLVRADEKTSWGVVNVPGMEAEHLPDNAKSRGQYLPLLELAVKENPDDPRCAHYLGREYMYYRRWNDAIRELERYLRLPTAVWEEERAAAMRYLAWCHLKNKNETLAKRWALNAIAEVPERRENWYKMEEIAYYLQEWESAVYYGRQCVKRTERSGSCINDAEAWGAEPWDLLSIGLWHTGDKAGAVNAARRAAEIEPNDERINKNLLFFCKEALSGSPPEPSEADPVGKGETHEASEPRTQAGTRDAEGVTAP